MEIDSVLVSRTKSKERLADVDARSEAAYADAEDLAAQLAARAAQISDDDEAIPIEVDISEDTSAVHHMEMLRERLDTASIQRLGPTDEP